MCIRDSLGTDIVFIVKRDNQLIELVYKKEWFRDRKSEQLDILPVIPAKVGDVEAGMPAAQLGLQRGDEIIKFAGQPIQSWEDMTKVIRKYPDQNVEISWVRDGTKYTDRITPQAFEEKQLEKESESDLEEASVATVGKIGISYYLSLIHISEPTRPY